MHLDECPYVQSGQLIGAKDYCSVKYPIKKIYASQEYLGEDAIFPVNASTPVSVMSSVCSNWAEGLPSAVAWVHASGQATGNGLPG